MFQFQRHSRRAGFYFFQRRIVIGDALGKNAHGFAALEHLVNRLKRVRHAAHRFGIILHAVDGNHAALREQPFHRFERK